MDSVVDENLMDGAVQHKTNVSRRNVSKACVTCRDSKTKCDGTTPHCGACTRKGRVCHYEPREDKRRVSFRPALEVLQRRVNVLHIELLKAGIAPPQMSEEDQLQVNKVLETLDLPTLPEDNTSLLSMGAVAGVPDVQAPTTLDRPQIELSGTDEPSLSQAGLSSDNATGLDPTLQGTFYNEANFNDLYDFNWDDTVSPDWPWMVLFPNDPETQLNIEPALGSAPPLSRPSGKILAPAVINGNGNTEVHTDDEDDQELAGQIAARFGSLHMAPDGRLRYFGTATNAHLFGSSKHSGPYSDPRSTKVDGERLLRNADLDMNVDSALEEHLLELYFSWHNTCNPLVDRSGYWTLRKQAQEVSENKGYYSEVLTNAMCAIGASYEGRYHPKLVTFPRPLADFFAERAKILLEIELDSPSVATVQALLLLSSHEIGFQRTARSWLYGGMAMRLCFDLGLHINAEPYVEHAVISVLEAQVRQMTFWACYVMNYRMSFSLGRPFTLDASEITVRKPSATLNTAHELRTTYVQPYSRASGPIEPMDLMALISEQRVVLCDLVEPIARALYGNTQISTQVLLQMSEKATSAMFNWKENLPRPLRLSEDPQAPVSSQLLVLLMEYHYLQILIHRPWTSRRLQADINQGRGSRHARQVCVGSACEMAGIVAIFERNFGCRRMDVETSQMLPSAALILIFAAISVSNDDVGVLQHLSTFLRALDELSNVHLSSRGHLDSLLLIQERWHRVYRQKKGKRRESTWHNTDEIAGSAKRRRPAM